MLFGIGVGAHGFVATQAALTMSAAGAAEISPNGAMDCGADDTASHAACVAMCATVVAILCEPALMPTVAALLDRTADVELPFSGHGVAPEPHPPKPSVLT